MVSVTGVGSGLDIENLVTQLVAAERAPLEGRLLRREVALTSELSGFGTLMGLLADLQARTAALRNPNSFSLRTVSSSDPAVVTATAGPAAVPGSYQLEVGERAMSQSLASQAFASRTEPLGQGVLTIRFGTIDVGSPVPDVQAVTGFIENPGRPGGSISIDGSNNSLEGIRAAINGAGLGISASIVSDGPGYRLLLTGPDTGAANGIEITVSDTGDGDDGDPAGLSRLAFNTTAANMMQTVAASDARFTLNGLALASPGNRVTGVLEGVTLDLKGVGNAGQAVTLTVAENRDSVRTSIEQLVTAYNNFITTAANLTRFEPATGQAGPLQGDAVARTVIAQVRSVLTASLQGMDGAPGSLAELGITTTADGSLAIDGDRLNAALQNGVGAMATLFSRPEGGIARRLDALLEGFLGGGGVLRSRTDGLQTRIDAIGADRETLSRRMESIEARYRAQFNALDGLLAQISSTGAFVAQQLANIPLPADRFRK